MNGAFNTKLMTKNIQTIFLPISILFLNSYAFAQQVDWAVSSSGFQWEYRYATVNSKNDLIVGGNFTLNNSIRNNLERQLLDSKGDEIGFSYSKYRFSNMILSYDSDGFTNWSLQMNASYNELYGIAHLDSTTVLLVMVDEYDTYSNGIPFGYFPEMLGEDTVKYGLNLFFLNSQGEYVKHKTLFEEYHVDISEFTPNEFLPYLNEGFVLSARVDPGLFSPGFPEATQGGSDLLMKIDQDGNIQWFKLISNHDNSCQSGFSSHPKLAISESGSIYISGTCRPGTTVDPVPDLNDSTLTPEERYKLPPETYIASVSASGEVNWMKTSHHQGFLKGIAAYKNTLLVGVELNEDDLIFDTQIDTTNSETDYLILFNEKGKLKWIDRNKTGSIHSVHSYPGKGYLISGRPNQEYVKKFGWASFYLTALEKRDQRTLFDSKLPVSDDELAPKLFFDSNKDPYLIGTLFFGTSTRLVKYSTKFHSAENVGTTPFILKFDFDED